MIKMINAEDLIDTLKRTQRSAKGLSGLGLAIDIIETFPTREAIQLIRCKDCKFFLDLCYLPQYGYCTIDNNDIVRNPKHMEYDGFCSRGVRRNDVMASAERKEE